MSTRRSSRHVRHRRRPASAYLFKVIRLPHPRRHGSSRIAECRRLPRDYAFMPADDRPYAERGSQPARRTTECRATHMAKLLIVDDQRNMRTTLAMMLRGAGFEVDEAQNGEEGCGARRRRRLRRRAHRSAHGLEGRHRRAARREDGAADDRGHRDDRVRHHRERRRGDALRRLRLHPEALHRAGAAREGRQGARQPPPRERGRAPRRRVQGPLQVREHRRPLALGPRGARPHRQDRAHGRHRPHHGRERHRQGARRARPSTRTASAPTACSCRSTAPPSPTRSSRASSSATPRARSRAPSPRARASSRRPTAARSSSTRSPRRRSPSRRSSCAPSRRARSAASARTSRSRSTSASSRRRTRTSSRRSPRSASARTSTTASTSRASSCRAARSARGPARSARVLPREVQQEDGHQGAPRRGRARGAAARTTSPATSASSST